MSLVAKAGGFVIVPGLLGRVLLAKGLVKQEDTLEKAAYKGAAGYAVIAGLSYLASKHAPSEALAEFAMGSVWGAGIAAATLAIAPQTMRAEDKAATLGQSKYGWAFGVSHQTPLPPARTSGMEKSGAAKIIETLTGY